MKAADLVKKSPKKKPSLVDWIGHRRKELTKGAAKLSSGERSHIVKQAEHGHKFRKKGGKSWKQNIEALERKGYSKESAEKIKGAQFWKERAAAK